MKRKLPAGLLFILMWNAWMGQALYAAGEMCNVFTLDTQVTVSCSSCFLEDLLIRLERTTEARFIYSLSDVRGIYFGDLNYREVPLRDILDARLEPHQLTYRLLNGRIVIKKSKEQALGNIQGKVYDLDHQEETLVGASVWLEGTGRGVVTDLDGNFLLKDVPEGDHLLVVSYIGYQSQRTTVRVVGNTTAVVNVPLTQDTEQLGEVVVTGEIPVEYAPIRTSTEVSMISSIKAETGIVTGISNQQISSSLDRDAADVMQRVPGVNLMNNFVLVRGLSQRYTMTYINGMMAPSTEEDQRAFSFNLLPSGLIDQILVYKSPAPELQGGFAGGVVKVSTKQSTTARRFQVSLSGQYRAGSSFEDGYTNSGSSGNDWLGFGLEDRMYDDRMYDPDFNWPGGNWYAIRDLTLKYPKPYDLEKNHTDFDKRLRINYYDSWKIRKIRLNNLTSLGYTGQSQFITGETNGNIIPQNSPQQAEEEASDWEAVDSLYNRQVRLSALQTLGLKLSNQHRVEFTGFFNRSVDDATNIRDKESYASNNNSVRNREVNYEYRVQDLATAQLSGEHEMGIHQVNWRVGKNYTSQKAPDIQNHTFGIPDSTYAYGVYQIRGVTDRVLRRGSFFTDEEGTSYGLDYRVKLWNELLLKAGGMYQVQERSFESWYYFLDNSAGSYSTGPIEQPWYHLSEIVNDSLVVDPGDVDGDGVTDGIYIGRDFSEGVFQVDNTYRAGYVGMEIPFLDKKFQVNAGLRYEAYERHLYDELGRELITSEGFDRTTGQPKGDTLTEGSEQTYWLPSAGINWNIQDNMRLTTSYGKTIDRPAYRETAPYGYYDFAQNRRYYGNAGLKDATIHNFDLRWEYYPTPGEFIAFGLFYKNMKNIIEEADQTSTANQTGYRYIYYINSPEASVKGLEIEVRRNLGFIPWKPLRYLSVIANYALMQNKLAAIKDTVNVPGDGKSRPFVGGAPYVLNANLYFEHPDWGTTFSVLVNSIGQRLVAAAGPRVSPIYELGRTTLDLVWKQRITSFLSLKAGVQNLLDAKILRYRDQNMDGRFDEEKIQAVNYYGWNTRYGTDYVTREYKTGSYYSLGLTMEW